MRKVIAGMNMTLDGFCDHTSMMADDEIHEHYNELLRNSGTLVYGRITYQLMENYWPMVVKKPSGNKPIDDFAVLIDNIPKVVFSRTLKNVKWKSAELAQDNVEHEISRLKKLPGKDILVGSPSLIVETLNLNLVDELQISVQPVLAGKGLTLFKNLKERIDLRLLKTRTFGCGAVTFYYEPVK